MLSTTRSPHLCLTGSLFTKDHLERDYNELYNEINWELSPDLKVARFYRSELFTKIALGKRNVEVKSNERWHSVVRVSLKGLPLLLLVTLRARL